MPRWGRLSSLSDRTCCRVQVHSCAQLARLQDVGGIAVSSVRDLGSGIDTAQPDGQPRVPHSPSDMMITYSLTNGGTLTLRASGTEPK